MTGSKGGCLGLDSCELVASLRKIERERERERRGSQMPGVSQLTHRSQKTSHDPSLDEHWTHIGILLFLLADHFH